MALGPEVEHLRHRLPVAEIADDSARGQGVLADQDRSREDARLLRQLGSLQHIYDLYGQAGLHDLRPKPLEPNPRSRRGAGVPRDEQTQLD